MSTSGALYKHAVDSPAPVLPQYGPAYPRIWTHLSKSWNVSRTWCGTFDVWSVTLSLMRINSLGLAHDSGSAISMPDPTRPRLYIIKTQRLGPSLVWRLWPTVLSTGYLRTLMFDMGFFMRGLTLTSPISTSSPSPIFIVLLRSALSAVSIQPLRQRLSPAPRLETHAANHLARTRVGSRGI